MSCNKDKDKDKGRGRRTDLYLMVDLLTVRQLLSIHIFRKKPIRPNYRDGTGLEYRIISEKGSIESRSGMELTCYSPC